MRIESFIKKVRKGMLTYSTPVNAAARKNNLYILNLLLKQNVEICDFCFYYCDLLVKIEIPASATTIGNTLLLVVRI